MTTEPPMLMMIDDVGDLVTVVDEKVVDFEKVMNKDNAPEKPWVDDHVARVKNEKDKEVP